MAAKPLADQVKPVTNLLGWMLLIFALALIAKGAGVLIVSSGWFYGFGSAFGLVFLEAIRLQAIHSSKEPPQ